MTDNMIAMLVSYQCSDSVNRHVGISTLKCIIKIQFRFHVVAEAFSLYIASDIARCLSLNLR